MAYCIHCGTHNPDAAKFCSNCGSTIVNDPVPAQSTIQNQKQPQIRSNVPLQAGSKPVTITPSNIYANGKFSNPALWGSILVVAGFFLPWFPNYSGYYYNSGSINGTGFVKSFVAALTQLDSDAGRTIGVIFGLLIYLIPVCAGIFLINAILSPRISGLVRLIRYIPFLVFLLFIALIIIANTSQGTSPNFSGFKIGIYMCLLGSVIMLSLRRAF